MIRIWRLTMAGKGLRFPNGIPRQETPMTDTLRTRIAAALKAETERRGIYWIADFDFPFLADAVIAALNESATECWDYWPARRCVILGTVNGEMTDSEGAK